MPNSESVAISLGYWVAAFPVVYAAAGVAAVAALAVIVGWSVGMIRRVRMVTKAKLIQTQVAGSQA